MAFAITQSCCSDAGCVSVCPVNCIHPAPGEPGFGSADILHIDPDTCIDCGACSDACPVDAIFPVDRLGPRDAHYAEVNAAYYRDIPRVSAPVTTEYAPMQRVPDGLRIAVVGTGPSAGYTVRALLNRTTAEITVIDRLPTPGGLIRSGVAPDHPSTKGIMDGFDLHLRDPRVTVLGDLEVGVDVTPAELAAHFHAVVYAIGASEPRLLGIPGEDLPGSASATDVVAWYNGVPDVGNPLQPRHIGRTVLVGTGNVALDIARLLHTAPDALARTDIADRSLPFLRAQRTGEVVVLGRRGPDTAAYTPAEYAALAAMPGVEIVTLDGSDPASVRFDTSVDAATARIVFLYNTAPVEILGDDRVRAVRVCTGDTIHDITADNVITSIGYRTRPVRGLPHDAESGRIPNVDSRILDGTETVTGAYVVGWARRGPSGGIGANRVCADETVQAIIDDAVGGLLDLTDRPAGGFARLLRTKKLKPVRHRGIRAIERERGVADGRPRVKVTERAEMLARAKARRSLPLFGRHPGR